MKNVIIALGFVYFLVLVNFYNKTNGFIKFFNEDYAFWKTTPVALLVLFTSIHGGGMASNDKFVVAAALAFGAFGDYLLGTSRDGIVFGAIAFGIGHLIYLYLFYNKNTRIYWPSVLAVLTPLAVTVYICLLPLWATKPIPVLIMSIYSLTLAVNVIVSVSQYINRNKKDHIESVFFRMLGFLIFLISDTVLIYHHMGFLKFKTASLNFTLYYISQFVILYSFVSRANASAHVKKN